MPICILFICPRQVLSSLLKCKPYTFPFYDLYCCCYRIVYLFLRNGLKQKIHGLRFKQLLGIGWFPIIPYFFPRIPDLYMNRNCSFFHKFRNHILNRRAKVYFIIPNSYVVYIIPHAMFLYKYYTAYICVSTLLFTSSFIL